jgi:ectoine hydroxylase-related dioxygenase (phytanoyl-CoA dioxygenase family)
MTPEQVLSFRPRVLSEDQREFYFNEGYLLLEKIIDDEWIGRLRTATDELIERSRSVTLSNEVWDLEPGHSADSPKLRRVSAPVDQHATFWAYVCESSLGDIVADLVGPDVKFHHSKINFKWARGGEEVKWHYDISFWPHTNYSPLTIGTYLYDCALDQGPLGVIPRSHLREELYTQYTEDGKWIGCLSERDAAALDLATARYLTGPAGSLTLHNCRTVHGSPRNLSDRGRPLLLNTLSSADAFPYTVNPIRSSKDQSIIRGAKALHAHHDPRPCLVPPDWSAGYSSIYALQQQEDRR